MISIIIPCYNSEKLVGRAVESVLKQTHTDFELLLIDNNSTDDTFNVLTKYHLLHPQKIRVFKEAKKGAPAARNLGLQKATGNWVQFLDADDELLPNKIAHQYNVAISAGADVISGSFIMESNSKPKSVVELTETYIWKALISSKLGVTSANLWKREALVQVNGWNETLTSSQEYNLLFRLLKAKANIVLDNEPLTIIHSIENSISQTTNAVKLEKILDTRIGLRLEIKAYLKQAQLLTPELDAYIDNFIYEHLMKRKIQNPGYIARKINELDLKVNFLTKLKYNAKYYAKRILFKNK